LSTVYFYKQDFSRVAQAPIPELIPDPNLTKPFTSTIDDAAAAVLEQFAGQSCWIEQVIALLAEDFKRWIGLVQTEGHVDWDQLWDALEGVPDRPDTRELLQASFEKQVKPLLSKTFRLKFELKGLDWSLVEKYRSPLWDGKEGLK
jgi:hypothetical protein